MVIATICLFAKLAVLASVQGKDSHIICCINCAAHTIQYNESRRRSSCVTVSYNFDWREQKRANHVEGVGRCRRRRWDSFRTSGEFLSIAAAERRWVWDARAGRWCDGGARVQGREAGGAGGGALRWLRCSGQPRTSDCCDLGWLRCSRVVLGRSQPASVPPRRDEHQTGAPGPEGAVDLAGPAALARRPRLRAPRRLATACACAPNLHLWLILFCRRSQSYTKRRWVDPSFITTIRTELSIQPDNTGIFVL